MGAAPPMQKFKILSRYKEEKHGWHSSLEQLFLRELGIQCGKVSITGKASELWFCTRCVKFYQELESLEKRLVVVFHLTKQSGQKPVKLCAKCNHWWCSFHKFICNNRIDRSQQSIFRGGWALKKERKFTRFSQLASSFLQEIFLQGEETGNKANPADVAPKMKRLR